MGLREPVVSFSLSPSLSFYYIPMTYLFYDGNFFDSLTYFANPHSPPSATDNLFSDLGAYWTNLQGTDDPSLTLAVSEK